MNKIFAAITAAGALAVATALPATAAPLLDDSNVDSLNGVTWGLFNEDIFEILDADTTTTDDAYDSIGELEWYIVGEEWSNATCLNADQSEATDSTGDIIVTCDSVNNVAGITGLESDVEARFYAEGDLARFTYTLTNNSQSSWDFDWWAQNSYGDSVEDNTDQEVLATGIDIQDNYDYKVGAAFGLSGQDGTPTEIITRDDDYLQIYGYWVDGDDYATRVGTIAPGESVSVVLFFFHNLPGSDEAYPSAAFASLNDWAADEFNAFDGRLIRGIDADANVINWGAQSSSGNGGNELASTGADITGNLALGGAAIAVGAVAMIVRRRRTV